LIENILVYNIDKIIFVIFKYPNYMNRFSKRLTTIRLVNVITHSRVLIYSKKFEVDSKLELLDLFVNYGCHDFLNASCQKQ
jgi:hypothetical protein